MEHDIANLPATPRLVRRKFPSTGQDPVAASNSLGIPEVSSGMDNTDVTPNGTLRRRRSRIHSEEDENLMDFLRAGGAGNQPEPIPERKEKRSWGGLPGEMYGSLDRSWARRQAGGVVKQRTAVLAAGAFDNREIPEVEPAQQAQQQAEATTTAEQRIQLPDEAGSNKPKAWRQKIENWFAENEKEEKERTSRKKSGSAAVRAARRRAAGGAVWRPTLESTDVLGTMTAIEDEGSRRDKDKSAWRKQGVGSDRQDSSSGTSGGNPSGSRNVPDTSTEAQQKKMMLRRLISMGKDAEEPGISALQVINELKEEEKKRSIPDKMTVYFRRPSEGAKAGEMPLPPPPLHPHPPPAGPAGSSASTLRHLPSAQVAALNDEIGPRFSRELQDRVLPKSLQQSQLQLSPADVFALSRPAAAAGGDQPEETSKSRQLYALLGEKKAPGPPVAPGDSATTGRQFRAKPADLPRLSDTIDIDSENVETPPVTRRAFGYRSFRAPPHPPINSGLLIGSSPKDVIGPVTMATDGLLGQGARRGGPSDDSGNQDDISDGSEVKTPNLQRRAFGTEAGKQPGTGGDATDSVLELVNDRSLQRSLRYNRLLQIAKEAEGEGPLNANNAAAAAGKDKKAHGHKASQEDEKDGTADDSGQFDRHSLARRTTRRSKRISNAGESKDASSINEAQGQSPSPMSPTKNVGKEDTLTKLRNWPGRLFPSKTSSATEMPQSAGGLPSAASRARRGSRTQSLIEPKDVEAAIKQHHVGRQTAASTTRAFANPSNGALMSGPSYTGSLQRSNSGAGQDGSAGVGVAKIAGAFKSFTRNLKPQKGEYKLNNLPTSSAMLGSATLGSAVRPTLTRSDSHNTRASNQSLSKRSSDGSLHHNQQPSPPTPSTPSLRRSAAGAPTMSISTSNAVLTRKLSSTASMVTNRLATAPTRSFLARQTSVSSNNKEGTSASSGASTLPSAALSAAPSSRKSTGTSLSFMRATASSRSKEHADGGLVPTTSTKQAIMGKRNLPSLAARPRTIIATRN